MFSTFHKCFNCWFKVLIFVTVNSNKWVWYMFLARLYSLWCKDYLHHPCLHSRWTNMLQDVMAWSSPSTSLRMSFEGVFKMIEIMSFKEMFISLYFKCHYSQDSTKLIVVYLAKQDVSKYYTRWQNCKLPLLLH